MGKIWKAVKWFFNVGDDSNKKIVRKHPHGVRPAMVPGDSPVTNTSCSKVDTSTLNAIARDPSNFMNVYNKAVKLAGEEEKGLSADALEKLKSKLIIPHGLKHAHIEHIISLCGFPKTESDGVDMNYDKRLVQLVHLAMNVYASEVACMTEKLVAKMDSAIAEIDKDFKK
ncbi:hypothetical protein F9Z84_06625 [Escherichia coli]|nr:hypothetical protein F9Z84_06625 [Escherichia coli]